MKNKLPFSFEKGPWHSDNNTIWIGSSLSLRRNLEKLPFPAKLPKEKQKQVLSLLSTPLLSFKELQSPTLLPVEALSPLQKEFVTEHFLSQYPLYPLSMEEAFVLDSTGQWLAALNLQDHLVLHGIAPNENLEDLWNHLIKIESHLSRSLSFAFSPKFGFLTANPALCGTALVGTVFLHLPALLYTEQLKEMVKKLRDTGLECTGIQGDPNEMIGDIVTFHNRYTLGVSEENILFSLRTAALKLIGEEKSLRRRFQQGNDTQTTHLKDKVSRAYGVLLHSYQLEAIEALHSISLIKMGIDLGWLSGATHADLNALLFACRRAHLLCDTEESVSHEELPHHRAAFIHKALQGLELKI